MVEKNIKIFKGDIIFTPTKDKFQTYKNAYIIIQDGKVKAIEKELKEEYGHLTIEDFTDKLIIPGFVDLHFHAPQFPNRGLGLDKELIPWLETYTFPEEGKYADIEYAKKVYSKVLHEVWKVGTTRIALFSSIHKDSTKILFDLFIKSGLGAYIGKVNMDRNSPEYILEDTENSIKDTIEIIDEYKNKSNLVKPIITPRFVPTCTPKLLEELGKIAEKYDLPVQSHLCENLGEVKWVGELHPNFKNYASIYEHYGLLRNGKSLMAHCIYNNEDEIALMAKNNVYAVHCPHSNYNLSSGIMPVRTFLQSGVPVGLGTDVSGGHALGIPSVIVSCIQASKIKWLENKTLPPITTPEAFYLGTKGGGSFFGKVGSFEEGYDFDALIIDDSTLCEIHKLTLEERIQKFIYIGDDRNIVRRYVQGELVKELDF